MGTEKDTLLAEIELLDESDSEVVWETVSEDETTDEDDDMLVEEPIADEFELAAANALELNRGQRLHVQTLDDGDTAIYQARLERWRQWLLGEGAASSKATHRLATPDCC